MISAGLWWISVARSLWGERERKRAVKWLWKMVVDLVAGGESGS